MRDLNDLRAFEQVALLGSFSAAAKLLGMPKSSVSRSVSRLEEELSTRLFQRTTRDVILTPAGHSLLERCGPILDRVRDAEDYFQRLTEVPRGCIRVTAGIGFGINVLSELIPKFIKRYPHIDVSLDLSSAHVDLVAARVDVAIRLGPMADSGMIATKIGRLARHLCATPEYLVNSPPIARPLDLNGHIVVEMPGTDGRPRAWRLSRDGDTTVVELKPRVEVNDPLTIYRLVLNGAGIGCVSGYVCDADVRAGRLVKILPEWTLPDVEVNVVFPSKKAVSPVVRSFVDFLLENSRAGSFWQSRLPDSPNTNLRNVDQVPGP